MRALGLLLAVGLDALAVALVLGFVVRAGQGSGDGLWELPVFGCVGLAPMLPYRMPPVAGWVVAAPVIVVQALLLPRGVSVGMALARVPVGRWGRRPGWLRGVARALLGVLFGAALWVGVESGTAWLVAVVGLELGLALSGRSLADRLVGVSAELGERADRAGASPTVPFAGANPLGSFLVGASDPVEAPPLMEDADADHVERWEPE